MAVALAQKHHRSRERSRLEMMCGYAEVRDCRREYLLNYFGENRDEPCGFCDNCKAGLTVETDSTLYPVGSQIVHRSWGMGRVMRYEGDKMVVLFDTVGYKTLSVSLLEGQGLVKPLE